MKKTTLTQISHIARTPCFSADGGLGSIVTCRTDRYSQDIITEWDMLPTFVFYNTITYSTLVSVRARHCGKRRLFHMVRNMHHA